MEKFDFLEDQKKKMVIWRKSHISSLENGFQNGKSYEHIIPKYLWKETLWSGIAKDSELPKYLEDNNIQAHASTHNLVSSWVNCANLYFPVHQSLSLKLLMVEFLKIKVSEQITEITDVELEFAFPIKDKLHTAELLGEMDGNRGSGQTSPDVAFIVATKNGHGLVLTESKYTEHSFYTCSARRTEDNEKRKGNPDPVRCMQSGQSQDYKSICHQTVWGRKYWNLLNISGLGKGILKRCPAATAGYQLFRQQALAEGIMNSGNYTFVASTVAFDGRNTDLIGCLNSTGINDFQTSWATIFEGKSMFKTWTHQEWVQFVRDNQINGEFNRWLEYLKERYDY